MVNFTIYFVRLLFTQAEYNISNVKYFGCRKYVFSLMKGNLYMVLRSAITNFYQYQGFG